jgi:hypothetical protein
MLYESIHGVKVGAFGCITHPTYPCIGASPDGIVVEPKDHGLYGRMVEIKNIFNREITGSPSEPYWIQMQMQMETCDLDVCDFIETRFKEYLSEDEFWNDKDRGQGEKGVVLYFIRRDHSPVPPLYKFIPLENVLEKTKINEWIECEKKVIEEDWMLYEIKYWYMDEYSCVLVKRNKKWFEAALPYIENIWRTILRERVEGYEHRAPKKKMKKMEENPENPENPESDNSKIVTIVQNTPISLVKLG